MNCVIAIAMENRSATKSGYKYITPEDVTEALQKGIDVNTVRLDVLEVLGGTTDFGAEDSELCAWLAWEGKTEKDDDDEEETNPV